MERRDFNCFSGNWPFHRVRYNTVNKIMQLHNRCGITGGFLSSTEAIFYQDPYEAEVLLARELQGTSYMHAMVLNPTLPGWHDDLKRGIATLKVKAVRVLPGFHGYSLLDPCMTALCKALRDYHLPLIITLRMEDERATYLFHPKSVDIKTLIQFLEINSDLLTLLANLRLHEFSLLDALFQKRYNLFADTSGLKDGLFAMEKVYQSNAKDHIVYGSLAPIFEMQATTLLVDAADIGSDAKEDIMSGSAFLSLLSVS